MDKVDEISRGRKQAHAKLQSLGSKVYDAFLQMEAATFSDGALSKKVKELIAVGNVTNGNDGTVSVIDTATKSVITTIRFDPGLGISPMTIAVTPDGRRVYVTDNSDNDTVWVIDAETNTVAQGIRISAPMAIAITPDGKRAYVTNLNDGGFLTQGSVSVTLTVGTQPLGIAMPP